MSALLDLDWKSFKPVGDVLYYIEKVYNLWANESVQLAAAVLGTVVVLSLLVKLALYIWFYIQPSKLQAYCHSETGSWALVTGASDGIGRAFVDELLDRGFNVLLHGRNREKLERITKGLAEQHPKRTVDFVVADASSPDHPEDAVVEKVKQLPGKLTILVNNVGGIHIKPQLVALRDTAAEDVDAQINTNARFPTQLIRALSLTLQQNEPSLILNCGSVGGLTGVPYIATYTATKAYVHNLTMALKAELFADGLALDTKFTKGIEVQAYIIGNTMSSQNKFHIPFMTTTSRDCARGCLARVGSGKALEYSSWKVMVQTEAMMMFPERMMMKIMAPQMQMRKAHLEKEE